MAQYHINRCFLTSEWNKHPYSVIERSTNSNEWLFFGSFPSIQLAQEYVNRTATKSGFIVKTSEILPV